MQLDFSWGCSLHPVSLSSRPLWHRNVFYSSYHSWFPPVAFSSNAQVLRRNTSERLSASVRPPQSGPSTTFRNSCVISRLGMNQWQARRTGGWNHSPCCNTLSACWPPWTFRTAWACWRTEISSPFGKPCLYELSTCSCPHRYRKSVTFQTMHFPDSHISP